MYHADITPKGLTLHQLASTQQIRLAAIAILGGRGAGFCEGPVCHKALTQAAIVLGYLEPITPSDTLSVMAAMTPSEYSNPNKARAAALFSADLRRIS